MNVQKKKKKVLQIAFNDNQQQNEHLDRIHVCASDLVAIVSKHRGMQVLQAKPGLSSRLSLFQNDMAKRRVHSSRLRP